MANEHYAAFISEAFVKPIRSVLIVDDDYPTFDEMLDSEIAHTGDGRPPRSDKKWYDAPQRIKNVIDSFRRPDRPLLVDIHDGANVDVKGDAKVASHLQQSDLLVLDYELDKAQPRDGSRAIEILRGLMSNNHFNLVVLHTSEDLDFVFREIVLGLLAPSDEKLDDADNAAAAALIAAREEIDDEVTALLRTAVTIDQYLHSRLFRESYARTMGRKQQPYSDFAALADAAGWDNEGRKLVLRRMLAQIETPLRSRMSNLPTAALTWSTSGLRWIKSESVFIAFSTKADHDDLFGDLQGALEAWNPAPSRLFMAKLRADMDEYGVVAQTEALERQHALAHWYARLLRAGGDERKWLVAESVARHSDQLLNTILKRVETFATSLVEAETKAANGDVDGRCLQHFKVDLSKPESKKKAEREHNAFVCSMPPQGWHLTTGHVFKMADEYWVCLSPACDLVPYQNDAKNADFGSRVPFSAVKLHPIADGKAPDVNSNLFVFLTLERNVKAFCFNSQGKEATAPVWRTLYAERSGMFGEDFIFNVSAIQAGSRKLISVVRPAQIVAQLRYEYALNLLQKLGTSMTRIGLDFAGG